MVDSSINISLTRLKYLFHNRRREIAGVDHVILDINLKRVIWVDGFN